MGNVLALFLLTRDFEERFNNMLEEYLYFLHVRNLKEHFPFNISIM